jgi:hypothetical protein
LHHSADDPEADQKLSNLVKARGFECVDASETGEAEMKEFVKESIVNRWGTMKEMNKRMEDTVLNAMSLSQVTAYYPLYLFIRIMNKFTDLTSVVLH